MVCACARAACGDCSAATRKKSEWASKSHCWQTPRSRSKSCRRALPCDVHEEALHYMVYHVAYHTVQSV